jgi:hypothetical protein
MTKTEITQAPTPEQRRADDQALPGCPLDWGIEGSPLPPSSIVYQYRCASWTDGLWMDINTQEFLDKVKSRPGIFTLRTLFTASMDDLVRAPNVVVLTALAVVDQARRDRQAAEIKLRAALSALEEMP